MSARIVKFTPLGKNLFLKKDWIATVTSSPMTGHASLKNSDVYPSGPGDLSPGILNNTP